MKTNQLVALVSEHGSNRSSSCESTSFRVKLEPLPVTVGSSSGEYVFDIRRDIRIAGVHGRAPNRVEGAIAGHVNKCQVVLNFFLRADIRNYRLFLPI
jgi:hypothetical protein